MPTITLMGRKLSDAVVFRIHEGIEDYRKDYKKYNFKDRYIGYNLPDGSKGIRMPTFFPYNNIVVQFDDGFDWYVTMDQIKSKGYEDDQIRLIANVFLMNSSEEIHMFKEICQRTTENGYTIERFEPDTFPIMLLSKEGYLMDMGVMDDGEHLLIVHGDMPMELKYKIQKFAQDTIVSSKKFLEMISCKNIAHELIQPHAKLQKKRKRSGKLPFKSYYVLKVKPIGRKPVDRKFGQEFS